jgi:uncharacterized damage-inducible protein DinB
LSGNVRQWIVCGVGGGTDERDRDSEFAEQSLITRDDLMARLKKTLADADAALARLDAGTLLERRVIQGLDVTILDAVFHVVEHFSMHTGQIIMMAKMFAEVDLGFYDFTDTKAILKWKSAPGNP